MRRSNALLLLLTCVACSSSTTPNEFIQQVSAKSDFTKTYQDDTYHLRCSYQPAELLALIELRGAFACQQPVSTVQLDSVSKSFSQAYYFQLRIGRTDSTDILRAGVSNQQEYAQRLNDLSFNLASQVYLLTPEQDTIRAILADLQRSYGMSPDATFLLAFPREPLVEEPRFDLVYQDQHFGLPAPVRFTFTTQELTKTLPKIDLP